MTFPIAGVTGNLTADPELRFTPKGDPVATFSVAVNERIRQGNEWVDGKPEFLRCEVWGTLAENVAESLTKGCQVIVNGRLGTEQYRDRNGDTQTSVKVRVSHVGVALARQTAQVTRTGSERRPASPGRDPEPEGWS